MTESERVAREIVADWRKQGQQAMELLTMGRNAAMIGPDAVKGDLDNQVTAERIARLRACIADNPHQPYSSFCVKALLDEIEQIKAERDQALAYVKRLRDRRDLVVWLGDS